MNRGKDPFGDLFSDKKSTQPMKKIGFESSVKAGRCARTAVMFYATDAARASSHEK